MEGTNELLQSCPFGIYSYEYVPPWLAECDRQAGRWTQACPWQREGKGSLSNTVYRTVFARRYRLSRPVCAQGADTCKGDRRHSANLFNRHDGDHDEAD